MTPSRERIGSGPFYAEQLRRGDRYELSDGHPFPTGLDFLRLSTVVDCEGASVVGRLISADRRDSLAE